MYKYLFKGPDYTLFTLTDDQNRDEGEDYIRGRYLSASEAMWRIFQFEITHKTPAVIGLKVHLPGQNLHQMRRQDNSQSTGSDLLRYFARPSHPSFDNLTYMQYYTNYRLSKHRHDIPLGENQWLEVHSHGFPRMRVIKRIREKPVGRLATVSPRMGELYYCRALLQVKPTRSFEQLRTVYGQIYPTFQQATSALGLFEHDTEAEKTLEEAVSNICSPSQLRFLFAQVIHNFPAPAVTLFQQYQLQLSMDFIDRTQNAVQSLQLTLLSISNHLRMQNLKLSDFGLPEPQAGLDEVFHEYSLYEPRQVELNAVAQSQLLLLNTEQRIVYDTIINSVSSDYSPESGCGRCIFIDGKAGRGKTFTVNTVVSHLRGNGHIVLICGSTALSMTLYEGGKTAHNLFGIPVTEVSNSI